MSSAFCEKCNMVVNPIAIGDYTTEIYNQKITGYEEFESQHNYDVIKFLKCPTCESPFLLKETFYCHWESGEHSLGDKVIFPTGTRELKNVPINIQNSYLESFKCFKVGAYEACQIMCRRTIELICKHYNCYTKNNLPKSILKLKDDGIIDNKLYDWASHLKTLGNIAAHNENSSFSKEDSKDSVTFIESILLYVFVLDQKFKEFQERNK